MLNWLSSHKWRVFTGFAVPLKEGRCLFWTSFVALCSTVCLCGVEMPWHSQRCTVSLLPYTWSLEAHALLEHSSWSSTSPFFSWSGSLKLEDVINLVNFSSYFCKTKCWLDTHECTCSLPLKGMCVCPWTQETPSREQLQWETQKQSLPDYFKAFLLSCHLYHLQFPCLFLPHLCQHWKVTRYKVQTFQRLLHVRFLVHLQACRQDRLWHIFTCLMRS